MMKIEAYRVSSRLSKIVAGISDIIDEAIDVHASVRLNRIEALMLGIDLYRDYIDLSAHHNLLKSKRKGLP